MKSQLAAPDMTAKADIPGDSRFSRALASSDFHTRSKGLEALHVWLQRKQNVPEMGLQKIWRGIMFCFWHSDKIQVQEQLADELVKIMTDLSDEVALAFFKAFLQTMFQVWGSIDKLRLDKFMLLVRKFFRGVFSVLLDHGWDHDLVGRYAACIHDHAFSADGPGQQIGFSLHLADVYIPELLHVDQKVSPSTLPHEQCVRLLQPFIAVAARSKQPTLLQRIKVAVLEAFAHELQNPQKGKHKCFSQVNATGVGDTIFEAGAAQGIFPRNRGLLYDASEAFHRIAKKRQREPAERATPSGQETVRQDDDAAAPSFPYSATVGGAPSTDSPQPLKKKKTRSRASKGSEGAIGKASIGERVVDDHTSTAGTSVSLDGLTPKPGKAGKKHASKNAAAAERREIRDGASKHASKAINGDVMSHSVMLTPQSAKALAGAVEKVKQIKSQRRISFDLKKNVVWSMNQPLPPAEQRTPPSAKPSGSALKKTSSVGKSKAARRLSL